MNGETHSLVKRVCWPNSSRAINAHLRGYVCILRILCALCGSTVLAGACSAADIRTWAFEATIVSNDDPLFEAAGVRIGDPVRGTFSVDHSLAADPNGDLDFASYTHPPAFQGIQLAIENPRTETRLEYDPLIFHRSQYWVEVTTSDVANDVDHESWISFYQTPVPPDPDWFDFIVMNFVRPGLATDLSLPTEFSLDDWPLAFIWLWADVALDGITAEIHTITPLLPGDFNFDAAVDAQDYASWRSAYGITGFSDADANRDGTVDAADYVVWRNGVGTIHAESLVNVPEPATLVMLCLGLWPMIICCRWR